VLRCTYRTEADRLLLDLELQNTTKGPIFGFTARPLQLRLPGKVTTHGWAHGWPTPSVLNDAPQIFDVAWPDGSIAICNEQIDQPLWIDLARNGKTDQYAVTIRYEGPPRWQEISGNDRRRFSLSLRFGAAGTNSVQTAKDIYQRFAERYPSDLKWDDRRPIGCNFLSSIESRSPTNPTGWLHDATIDMSTDAGRADWRKRMLARADKSVSVAKEMGCQGVIVWDIEGQRNPHNISYIGDPRLMPTLSPEMDTIADEFFKKYTDAGLRCGVTLRTTHVVRTPGGKNDWEHINVEDIVAEISGKLEYAHKRWGCTLFYVDSTLRWDLGADGQFALHTLPAEIFQTLHAKYPDVLLIPEQSITRYHAYTAPYHEVMPPHNYAITPPQVRAAYPNAFSVIRVADIPVIEKNFDALVAAVRSGDIIMFRTWLDDADNVPVKRILDAAKR
ncbi:MAG: Ig domain protein group 2 domain protein, partial [Phycisphaerales bacterium]|nr:Ig domain protein group 2 domain protein [Phycisphaerales bacterium]